jgi:hypothetical protein
MSSEARDARTTPPWARGPWLVSLSGLVVYFLLCFHFANRPSGIPDWAWFGGWKMFTTKSTYHYEVEADALYEDGLKVVDLEALFTYRWDSGPRYTRGPFRRNGYRLRVLAASTCGRLDSPPEAIRLREVKWKKTVGQHEQPRDRRVQERTLLEWRCGTSVKLAGGRSLP